MSCGIYLYGDSAGHAGAVRRVSARGGACRAHVPMRLVRAALRQATAAVPALWRCAAAAGRCWQPLEGMHVALVYRPCTHYGFTVTRG
jgi:hypothetical protein